MKNVFKSELRTLTAALTLGALSFGFAPTAMAISTYDAVASFELTLTDVTDVGGTTVTSGWEVFASGSGDVFLSDNGNASASGAISVIDPAVSLSIFDWIIQTSSSSGTATNGFSWTDALTDLDITVDNFSGQDLTFSFDFSAMTDAMTTGDDASATATVDMLDDLGFVDILAVADALSLAGQGTTNTAISDLGGTIVFTLMDGEVNVISGFVDSYGEAASVVPVPAAVWLFGSGLLGLVGIARRKPVA